MWATNRARAMFGEDRFYENLIQVYELAVARRQRRAEAVAA